MDVEVVAVWCVLFALAFLEALVVACLAVFLPANALAATSESTPVRTTLPAINQRVMRLRSRSAASRV